MATATFGQWLRRQLTRHEWTQADLARKVRTSTGTVSDWLNDKRLPNPDSCDRLADALGEDPDYVLQLAGHRPYASEPDNPEVAALISLVRRVRWNEQRLEPVRVMLEEMVAYDRQTAAGK